MKKWFNSNLIYIVGALIGAVAGFMYWNFIGCQSGSCSITSSPVNSTLYGSLMGAVLLSVFKKENKSVNEKKEHHEL